MGVERGGGMRASFLFRVFMGPNCQSSTFLSTFTLITKEPISMRGVSIFESQSHMESLSVDLKTSQPLLIATDGTGFSLHPKFRKGKEKESFVRAPFAQAIAFDDPSPNPIRRSINPFHDAII